MVDKMVEETSMSYVFSRISQRISTRARSQSNRLHLRFVQAPQHRQHQAPGAGQCAGGAQGAVEPRPGTACAQAISLKKNKGSLWVSRPKTMKIHNFKARNHGKKQHFCWVSGALGHHSSIFYMFDILW